METNQEFINRYKDPSEGKKSISNKIESTYRRIKDTLGDLIELGLMQSAGTAPVERGTGTKYLYKFTWGGYLLASIIKSFNEGKRDNAVTEVYNVLNSILDMGDSSASPDIFFCKFFKKCYERHAFGDIVSLLREILSEGKILFYDTRDLLQRLVRLEFKDKNKSVFFLSLWNETLEELDEEVKDLFMYQLKLEIERRMEVKVQGTKLYEQTRYSHRDKPDIVALECRCLNCNLFVPTGVRLLQYRKAHAYQKSITAKCPYCQIPSSLRIPILDDDI